MKLQKLLATMEVSQRVRKIVINLEMYEDRKVAHKLQKEVDVVPLSLSLSLANSYLFFGFSCAS